MKAMYNGRIASESMGGEEGGVVDKDMQHPITLTSDCESSCCPPGKQRIPLRVMVICSRVVQPFRLRDVTNLMYLSLTDIPRKV